jgi:hypothetical protein
MQIQSQSTVCTAGRKALKLELSGDGDVYPIVMACDTIYGSLTISKMISYAEAAGKKRAGGSQH